MKSNETVTPSQPRAAIYVRVSSNIQEDEGTSLQTQLQRCRAYAAEHGYAVAEECVYTEVHTGVELWQRPMLTNMRDALRQGSVQVLVCFAIDRLARDPVHLGVILSEAQHHGVGVEFVTEPLDSTPEGQLIRFVRGYAAKVEHEKFRERSLRGRLARIESGKLMPGPRPRYGYRWIDDDKSAYAIDPVTGPVVQRMFDLALSGESIRAIAMTLTGDTIPAPRGGVWRHTTVRGILRDVTYTGHAQAWRYESHKNNDGLYRIKGRAEEDRVNLPAGVVPTLITGDVFAAVQQHLDTNKERSLRNARNPEDGLLRAGYVRCGYCGRTLRVTYGGGSNRHARYTCQNGDTDGVHDCQRHSIDAATLDTEVWTRVERLLTRPEIIKDELERMRTNDPTLADVDAVDRAKTELERQRRNLTRAIVLLDDDPDAAAPLVSELRNISTRMRALDVERASILERRASWEYAQEHLAELQDWCSHVAERITQLTWAQKRNALDVLGVKVRLFRKNDPDNPRYIITAKVQLDSGQNENIYVEDYFTGIKRIARIMDGFART
jgi:site-specific DNA recombinase